ncbi:MAG TPA: hypothetical protein VMZ91_03925 [Candidatus Paceibacterota bacterium]|nr:hypothetical protein [Candidatus Paceibacterota bacterium]
MDTWGLLEKELNYYGIRLINNKKCQFIDNEETGIQGVIQTVRILNGKITQQKKILLSLWKDVVNILKETDNNLEIIDDRMVDLFIFSLKDLLKYLQCFDKTETQPYSDAVSMSLTRDFKTFNKSQIYTIPDYKIAIDWVSRNISRLLYICNLLSLASMGRNRVSKYEIKTAKGISGPWAHLDLPLLERVFPFGFGLRAREKGKQKQNRYTKGLENYNGDFRVGEGHYWRELRNEPYSWSDRANESPYPTRNLLSR